MTPQNVLSADRRTVVRLQRKRYDSRRLEAPIETVDAARARTDKTHLAREWTILAHIRTGISMFIFGTVIVGFFSDKDFATELGSIAIAVGMLFFPGGWISHVRSNRRIRTILAEIEEPLEHD